MRLHTVLAIIAAIVLAVMVFSPEAEARIPKRKLAVIKRIGLALILLKGKKKTLFPLPIPLPLPLPVVKHLQPEPYPEPIHEPVYLPAPEQSYSAPSYSSQQSYGGGMDLSGYGGNEGLY